MKAGIFKRQLGKKAYELKDHLGNVRVTFSDIKIPTGDGSQPFMVDLLSKSEYYPYGMVIDELSYNLSNNRYGFGGTHEMDNEVKGGVGNHLSFGDFGYDTRVARRFNLDPIDQVDLSNYSVFYNDPISIADPSGYSGIPTPETPTTPPPSTGGGESTVSTGDTGNQPVIDVSAGNTTFEDNTDKFIEQPATATQDATLQSAPGVGGGTFAKDVTSFVGDQLVAGSKQVVNALVVLPQMAKAICDNTYNIFYEPGLDFKPKIYNYNGTQATAEDMVDAIVTTTLFTPLPKLGRISQFLKPIGTNTVLRSSTAVVVEETLVVNIITANGIKLTGFTQHGVQQAIYREVKTKAILDALKNPLKISEVLTDNLGRQSQRFIGRSAEVAINPKTGKILSVNPISSKKLRKLLKGTN